MKKLRFFLWIQLLVLPLIVFSSFSGCEKEEEIIVDVPELNDSTLTGSLFGYYQIPANELNGWDEGFYYANESGTVCPYYIVLSTDSVNGDIIVCLNETNNTDAEKSLVLHFSKRGDILKISMPGYYLDAESDAESVDFVVYKEKGDALGVFSVPYIKDATRVGEFNFTNTIDWSKFMSRAADFVGNVWNFAEGNYGGVVSDLLLGKIIGAVKRFDIKILVATGIKKYLELLYQRDQNLFMGSAEIKIVSVKRSSSTTVTVEGEISNIASIPSYRIGVVDGLVGYVDNIIYYGIAVGKNEYAGYYLNENCTELEQVDKELFTFTFYMEETLDEVFYFRPFLIPKTKIKEENNLIPDPYTCIRYGDAKMFMDVDIYLGDFEQTKCVKESGGYNIQFTIYGGIYSMFDNLGNWGFYVTTKSAPEKYFKYYAKDNSQSYIVPMEKCFTCDVKIAKNDITTDFFNKLITEIKITPFVEFRNSLLPMVFDDRADFYTLKIQNYNLCSDDNHPHAIDLGLPSGTKWACCNVGTSSPESIGGRYAWGETETKGNYSHDTYEYYDWTYGCYILDEDFDISGTKYDVAHVKWGGNWHMPTLKEIQEFINNCTWIWTFYNEVEGVLVTGPSGNDIFFSHGPYNTYWSATSYERTPICGKYDGAYSFSLSQFGGIEWMDGSYKVHGKRVRPVCN